MSSVETKKTPPPRPPPPAPLPKKSLTFSSGMRLNDLLREEEEEESDQFGFTSCSNPPPATAPIPVPPIRQKHISQSMTSSAPHTGQSAISDAAEKRPDSVQDLIDLNSGDNTSDQQSAVDDTPPRMAAGGKGLKEKVKSKLSSKLRRKRSTSSQQSAASGSGTESDNPGSSVAMRATAKDPVKQSVPSKLAQGELHRPVSQTSSAGSALINQRASVGSGSSVSMDTYTKSTTPTSILANSTAGFRQPYKSCRDPMHPMTSVREQPVTAAQNMHNVLASFAASQYRVTVFVALVAATVVWPGLLVGFLWGLFACWCVFIGLFVAAPESIEHLMARGEDESTTVTVTEHDVEKLTGLVHKGFMNQLLQGKYDPTTFHVNQTKSVLVRVHGSTLRITQLQCNVLKHGLHDDWSLKPKNQPKQMAQTIYDLTGAKIRVRPRRIANRRWWSRKYPICVTLASADGHCSSDTDSDSEMSDVEVGTEAAPDTSVGSTSTTVPAPGPSNLMLEVPAPEETGSGSLPRSLSTGDLDTPASAPVILKTGKSRAPRDRSVTKYLYLFARCAREKEHWFHKLRQAASLHSSKQNVLNGSCESLPVRALNTEDMNARGALDEGLQYSHAQQLFLRYMRDIMPAESISTTFDIDPVSDPSRVVWMDLGRYIKTSVRPRATPSLGLDSVVMANAVGSRIFYDFCRDRDWIDKIRARFQMKLSTLRLPYFVETLTLTRVDPGSISPKITGVHNPYIDDWGLWIDVEVSYTGLLRLTLETKLNLMKLKTEADSSEGEAGRRQKKTRKNSTNSEHYFSDEDRAESPESSPDEADEPSWTSANKTHENTPPRESTKRRLVNAVERLTASKYFKQAADYAPVKKLMEGVSSTPLTLMVEITRVQGTIAVNIAAPPSDRLCINNQVEFPNASSGRIRLLIEKNLVLPNMDDISVPLMSGNPMLARQYNM